MGDLVKDTDFRAILRSVGHRLIDRIADGLSLSDVEAAATTLIAQKIPALVDLGQKTDAGPLVSGDKSEQKNCDKTPNSELNAQKTAEYAQKTESERVSPEPTADAPYKNDLPISMDSSGRIYWRGARPL